MKKLVFAAIATFVMVSVSNVFANGSKASFNTVAPADTTVTDTVAPAAEPAEEQAASTDSTDDTAMLMFSDSTSTDSAVAIGGDSSAVAML